MNPTTMTPAQFQAAGGTPVTSGGSSTNPTTMTPAQFQAAGGTNSISGGGTTTPIGAPSQAAPGGFLGKLALGIAPVLGDIGEQKTGRQIFGDSVATLLNLGTFFLAPEAVPEEVAGEAALEGGADAAANAVTQAPTRLQQIGGMLGRGAQFGALTAGSTAAQDIGNSKSAGQVIGDTAKSFGVGTGLGVAAEGVGSLLSSGLQKASGIRDWLNSSGAPMGAQAVDQLDQAENFARQRAEISNDANADPTINEGVRQKQIEATQAAMEPIQQASKNLVDKVTQVLGTGAHFDVTGQAIIDSDRAYDNLYRQNRDALYNQIIPANSSSPLTSQAEEGVKNALNNSVQELSLAKGAKPEWYTDLVKMRDGLFGNPDSEHPDVASLIGKNTDPDIAAKIRANAGIPPQTTPTLGELNATLQHSIESDKGIQEVLSGQRTATNSERLVLNVRSAMKDAIDNTLKEVDPTAMTIKDKADAMVRANKTYIETNPFVQIIRDADLKGKPELMLQRLISTSLGKNTELALQDVDNFYRVLGGETSPQAIAFKESLVSSILKTAGGPDGTAMYTKDAVDSLTKNIDAVKKTGLLPTSVTNTLEDLRDRSQVIIDNNVSRTNYINGLRNPDSQSILPSVEEAQKTATQLNEATKISDISDRMNKNPESVVSDFVKGKYSEKEMDTIMSNLDLEQQKVLTAKVNENIFGKIASKVSSIERNPATAITEKSLPDMMKAFEQFKNDNPTIVSKFFDPKTLNNMQDVADSITEGGISKAVKNARTMGTFRAGMAVFEALRGSPMALYMGARASMDFERAALLAGEEAPDTLTEYIEKLRDDSGKMKSAKEVKSALQSVVTPVLKGVAASEISKESRQP